MHVCLCLGVDGCVDQGCQVWDTEFLRSNGTDDVSV